MKANENKKPVNPAITAILTQNAAHGKMIDAAISAKIRRFITYDWQKITKNFALTTAQEYSRYFKIVGFDKT